MDEVSDLFDTSGAYALPQNSAQRSERALAAFDSRIRLVTHFVYDVPFGKGKWYGNWRLSGVHTVQSGQPFTINTAVDWNADGNLTDRPQRGGFLQGPINGDRRVSLALAPGATVESLMPASGTENTLVFPAGTLGRNAFRGPGIRNLDFAAMWSLLHRELWNVVFRVEVFNVENHANFAIPIRTLSAPGFGDSVSETIRSRTVQLALKLNF
jgi:hypothetical protein